MFKLQIGQNDEFLFKSLSGIRVQSSYSYVCVPTHEWCLGNFALLVFVLIQCSLLVSLYTSGIITSVVTHKPTDRPFEPSELADVLLSGRYTMVTDNSVGVSGGGHA